MNEKGSIARADGLLVVGCGYAGGMHAAAFRKCFPSASLLCVGRNSELPESFAARYGGRPYQNITEALAEKQARAAVIATPPSLHAQFTLALLNAGLDVMVEKPMAASMEEAAQCVEIARKRGRVLAVGHVLRCVGVFRLLRRIIQSGELGQIMSWHERRFAFRQSLERKWWPLLSSGLLGFQGIHALDLVVWILGPLNNIQVTYLHRSAHINWYDAFRLQALIGNSIKVEIEHSFAEPALPSYRLTITGTKGEAQINDFKELKIDGVERLYEAAPLPLAFNFQMQRFITASLNPEVRPVCTGSEGLAALEHLQRSLDFAVDLT